MRRTRSSDTAVVILAGGDARRFPGKLEHIIGGEPMLFGVYRAMRATGWPVYVAGKGSFSRELDARLDCPLLLDRWPGSGPLAALISACGAIAHERIYAVAGDEPLLDASLPTALAAAWQPGDRAVVPEHDGRLEPLAALYARSAVLSEGLRPLDGDRAGMHGLIERLDARRVVVSSHYFSNVNTPADLGRVAEARA